MEKSRLKSHLKKKAFQNVLFAFLGIVAVIVFLIVFGTHILVGFSLFMGQFTDTDDTTALTQQQPTYIAPPTLDPIKEATNSDLINITGYAVPNQTVSLYRNASLVQKTKVQDDNRFTFTSVHLEKGKNTFKASVATQDNKKSEYSKEIIISLLKDVPSLSIDTPQDGQKFKKEESPIKVTGSTDADIKVTVNDFRAIVTDSGSYSYLYNLKDGENTIKVVAIDAAGNKSEKELKITTE